MPHFMKTIILAAATAVTLPAVASADTITLSQTSGSIFGDPALFDTVKIGGDTTDTMTVYAGGFHVSSASESFMAWCIELAEYLALPSTYTVVDSPFTAAASTSLSQLFTGFVEDIDTGVKAAAFQVAIWELISDDQIDLSSGGFQVLSNAAVKDQANDYLTGLSTFTPDYDLRYFVAGGTQDLITGQPAVMPLPATGLMLLAGLGALGVARRKRS